MGEPTLLKPDQKFVDSIIKAGGENVKKCFQCATCSVTCELSPDRKPFPRKEMIWAQWGLKDRLVADPDIWLCHQCNDCSIHCPRGARPGDVLAAIRQEVVVHYAVPGFLGRLVNTPRFVPYLFIIPAILLGLSLLAKTPVEKMLGWEPHHGAHWEYANLFPHWLLNAFFNFFAGLAAIAGLLGIRRFWRAMKAADGWDSGRKPEASVVQSFIRTLISIIKHNKFTKCTDKRSRFLSHFIVFYGFMGLFFLTGWAIIVMFGIMPLTDPDIPLFTYPFGLWNPANIAGNIFAIALIAGCILMIRDRMQEVENGGSSNLFDWMFVIILLSVGITGVITEFARFADFKTFGYILYFAHLVLVFALLIYLPYSKFAHMLYRTTALVYGEYSGRNKGKAGPVKIREKEKVSTPEKEPVATIDS